MKWVGMAGDAGLEISLRSSGRLVRLYGTGTARK